MSTGEALWPLSDMLLQSVRRSDQISVLPELTACRGVVCQLALVGCYRGVVGGSCWRELLRVFLRATWGLDGRMGPTIWVSPQTWMGPQTGVRALPQPPAVNRQQAGSSSRQAYAEQVQTHGGRSGPIAAGGAPVSPGGVFFGR